MEFDLDRNKITPPKTDEIELTFFGPGFGESIVVHIPGIGWGIIDSCEFGPVSGRFVPPLQYVIYQKVNRLAFLVLTHPHADHFKGMEQIVDHYLGRIDRVCRYAGDGARELGVYLTNRAIKGTPGAKSLSSVFKAFKKAVDNNAESRRLGAMTQIIPRKQVSINGTTTEVEVLSLSPSAYDEQLYVNILRVASPELTGIITEIPDSDHNLVSSAIWISAGDVVVILGSDVEKGRGRSSGWRGIIGSVDAPGLPVKALKVSHHGSPSAYYKKAWEQHCGGKKITSVVTPFARGKQPRPSEEDIERIKKFSSHVGLTSQLRYVRALDVYDRAVARRLMEKKWKIIQAPQECGMITVRYDLTGNAILHYTLPPAHWAKPEHL
jgi:hypothetical protein